MSGFAENAELRRPLGTNSANSSKPPSSDGLAKPARKKSLRGKTGRKPGGQSGHPGSTLAQVADPGEIVRHEPVACAGCGSGLAQAREVGVERRQVFDLPPVTVRVTEHQLVARRCGCGVTTRGVAPETVRAPVSHGPEVTAIILCLYAGQFLSKARTAQALAELFGTPVSPGTVASITRRAAAGLAGFLALVRGEIAAAEVAHFDETGLRVDGRLRWVHSASTGKYSLIWVHDKRGRVAMDACGVLPSFTGIAVHDAWAPYDCYTAATHALCNAHLLRELVAVAETAGVDERGWCWGEQVRDALLALKTRVEQAIADGAATLDPAVLALHTGRIRSAALIAAQATRGRRKSQDACARWPAPATSPRSAHIWPPPPNMAWDSYTSWPNLPKAMRGYQSPHNLTSYGLRRLFPRSQTEPGPIGHSPQVTG